MDRSTEKVVVISSDAHAGADLMGYRPYLETKWHAEFDEWAKSFSNPFESEHLLTNDPTCNWDSAARNRLQESQGVVAEVIFPNTVPPFFPQTQFFVPPPARSHDEFVRRWAGLQAHNRWLAEFCALLPGRRAGVAQIMLEDIDAAVEEIRWAHANGLTGGILLPGVAPGSTQAPLYSREYEAIWAECASLGMPVNLHSGGGIPEYVEDPVAMAVLLKEVTWFANRSLSHLVLGGVFERHPEAKVCFTEQGAAWVVAEMATLDSTFLMMQDDKSSQHFFGGPELLENLSLLPSEYIRRNCHFGTSPLRRAESEIRYDIGVDQIMWGNDFPHTEGTYPYAIEAIQYAMHDVPEGEIRQILAGNAAGVYGFDLDLLAVEAARVGPSIATLQTPLESVPADSLSTIFVPAIVEKKRALFDAARS